MELKYSIQPKENMVKAMGRDMNVPFKDMVMVAEYIRGKRLSKALESLEAVAALKRTIPYKRFNKGIGHRKGDQFKLGKYPRKAAKFTLGVLKNLQANAEFKGYDPENVKIIHSQAQHGVTRPRRKPKGRWGMWKTEYCHLQIVAKEI